MTERAIAICSMSRCIEAMPDEALKDAWLATPHGSMLYYLGLSELVYERRYDPDALLSEHAEPRDTGGCSMADMAWIDSRRGK